MDSQNQVPHTTELPSRNPQPQQAATASTPINHISHVTPLKQTLDVQQVIPDSVPMSFTSWFPSDGKQCSSASDGNTGTAEQRAHDTDHIEAPSSTPQHQLDTDDEVLPPDVREFLREKKINLRGHFAVQ